MPKERADRLRTLIRDRLEPRRIVSVLPVEVAVWQCGEPVSVEAARRAEYNVVPIGWRWGPVWSTAWFRLRARIADVMRLDRASLLFSCGTEATLWSGDGFTQCDAFSREAWRSVPLLGLDVNHMLVAPAVLSNAWCRESDQCADLYIEAACNRPLGATTFFWDDAAEVARWKEPLPGALQHASLVQIDETYDHYIAKLSLIVDLMEEAPTDMQAEGERLAERVTSESDPTSLALMIQESERILSSYAGQSDDQSCCRAIGHAHIDTAWLWTLQETRRKCLRTFSTALRLLEANKEFRFLCTQPQQYAWVEKDSPELFRQMQTMIREGRWEVGAANHADGSSGAMWIEPDCNIPSGESLIRQFLHGERYVRERFGATSSHPYVFLPDTFGFPGSMPQILAGCGVRTFIFNKLWWNESNAPKMSLFNWCGIDGTNIVSYLTPGMEYNATMTAKELLKGDANHRRYDAASPSEWLQPFGYGDGGGGPTQGMIDLCQAADSICNLPYVQFTRVDQFCDRLHARCDALRARGHSLPTWPESELYLERHRGTYTTQSWIKHANRDAEEQLRLTELLICCRMLDGGETLDQSQRNELDDAWKLVLLNQFHDILPGSSIGAVYETSRQQYRTIRETAERVTRRVLSAVTTREHATKRQAKAPELTLAHPKSVVVNPSSQPRSSVMDINGVLQYVIDVPAVGVRSVTPSLSPVLPSRVSPVTVRAFSDEAVSLDNGVIGCTIRNDGTISNIITSQDDVTAFPGSINRLALYEDTPKYWEAWDIDREYVSSPVTLDPAERCIVRESGPLRATVVVERAIGRCSRVSQTISLDASARRIDVRCDVDWREERRLLRVLFPTNILALQATYGIQFGHIDRPTSLDTAEGAARFEVCAHRWMNLSGTSSTTSDRVNGEHRTASLSILSAGIYGHSCHGGTLGLTLLRSTRFPDASADIGQHLLRYSIMPHHGDWRSAGVDVEAESFNRPLKILEGTPALLVDGSYAPLHLTTVQGDGRVEIVAFKPAEGGNGVVVRLVEVRGKPVVLSIRWNCRFRHVTIVNPLEQPQSHDGVFQHEQGEGRTRLALRPFQILSLRIES